MGDLVLSSKQALQLNAIYDKYSSRTSFASTCLVSAAKVAAAIDGNPKMNEKEWDLFVRVAERSVTFFDLDTAIRNEIIAVQSRPCPRLPVGKQVVCTGPPPLGARAKRDPFL